MFTWNLPALIRNVVILGIICIFVNWVFLAWVLILFLWFVEMDEELSKYETYSDYYTDQLALYDFSKVSSETWNLEEQLRVFNEQNPEVIQQYQKTFSSRIHELRKRPTTIRSQDTATKIRNKKEELKFKQEAFGYTENYWDEQDTLITNEYVEVLNHISSISMYEWYHQHGLVVPQSEYGIKTMCLYQNKYAEAVEDNQSQRIGDEYVQQVYQQLGPVKYKNKKIPLYYPTPSFSEEVPAPSYESLLYWQMTPLEEAKYDQCHKTQKKIKQQSDARINCKTHLEHLAQKSQVSWIANVNQMTKLQTLAIKKTPSEAWHPKYATKLHYSVRSKKFTK